MKLTLARIAHVTDGRLIVEDRVVTGVSTDTRTLQKENLFVALIGKRFDPHKLIEAGRADDAGAVLVEHRLRVKCPQIVVHNTYAALQSLAGAWRDGFKIPVVGITGSNGKTSGKELTRRILATQGDVLATHGNLNNHIGVPLTLLGLHEGHRYAVIEMGANHAGEIEKLAQLVNPDVGVITNVGPAHLEGFGSIEGVARAKAELYRCLNPRGIAVVNADEPYRRLWEKDIGQRKTVTFGMGKDVDVSGRKMHAQAIKITTSIGEIRTRLQASGSHVTYNALAAVAACLSVGVGLDDIKAGLEGAKPVSGRLVPLKGVGGARILDDSYNANPASLYVALDVQAQEEGESWLVFGDMGELGKESITLHREAGEMAREFGVTRLLALGELARYAADSFGKGATHFSDHAAIIKVLRKDLHERICVLIKGSRAMQLEKIVAGIRLSSNLQTIYNEHAA